MQKEGNYLCFVIALIGGILNFILGVLIAFSPTFKFYYFRGLDSDCEFFDERG